MTTDKSLQRKLLLYKAMDQVSMLFALNLTMMFGGLFIAITNLPVLITIATITLINAVVLSMIKFTFTEIEEDK
jgi:hypothetical protein